MGIDFDKYQKLVGPIEFNKQLDRPDLPCEVNPHEKWFEFLKFPTIYSKNIRSPNPTLDTHVNRDNVFGVKSGGLAYEPNYSQIFERNNISVLDMSKITSRLPVKKMVYTLNE